MYYCLQCFNSIKGDCPHEYCERRLQETGSLRKQETKMTRQEAIDKLDGKYPVVNKYFLINALEALGLIKFEEEKKKELSAAQVIELFKPVCSGRDVINDLEAAGYRIVKIGANSTVVLESSVEMPTIWVGRAFNGKLVKINQ